MEQLEVIAGPSGRRRRTHAEQARIAADARRMGLVDGVNTVAASGGTVLATGVPAFLDRVDALASV